MYVLGSKRTSLTITVYNNNKCSVPTHLFKMLCQLKTYLQKQILVYTDIIVKICSGSTKGQGLSFITIRLKFLRLWKIKLCCYTSKYRDHNCIHELSGLIPRLNHTDLVLRMDKYFSKQDQVPQVYRNISSVPGPVEFSIDWNKGVVATSTSTTYIQVHRHVGPPLLEQKRTHARTRGMQCSVQLVALKPRR